MTGSIPYWKIMGSALLLVLLLTGCKVGNDGSQDDDRDRIRAAMAKLGERHTEAFVRFANKTIRTYEPEIGTQIEFNSDKGFAYLWYPGNKGVVVGHWKLQFDRAPAGGVVLNICHFYNHRPHDSANVLASHKWYCRNTEDPKPVAVEYEMVPGDPFDLEKWTDLPCILNKERGEIAQIVEKYRECKALPGVNRMSPLNSGAKAGG